MSHRSIVDWIGSHDGDWRPLGRSQNTQTLGLGLGSRLRQRLSLDCAGLFTIYANPCAIICCVFILFHFSVFWFFGFCTAARSGGLKRFLFKEFLNFIFFLFYFFFISWRTERVLRISKQASNSCRPIWVKWLIYINIFMICQGGSSSRGSAGSSRGSAGSNQHENNKNCLASCQSYAISQVCAPFGHVPSLSPSLAWPGLSWSGKGTSSSNCKRNWPNARRAVLCRLVSSTFWQRSLFLARLSGQQMTAQADQAEQTGQDMLLLLPHDSQCSMPMNSRQGAFLQPGSKVFLPLLLPSNRCRCWLAYQ